MARERSGKGEPHVVSTNSHDVETAEGPEQVRGRERTWNVVITAVLLAGITLSTLGAYAWHSYVQTQAKNGFSLNASSVSAAVSSAIRADADFVAIERAEVVSFPALTNRDPSTFRSGFPAP